MLGSAYVRMNIYTITAYNVLCAYFLSLKVHAVKYGLPIHWQKDLGTITDMMLYLMRTLSEKAQTT